MAEQPVAIEITEFPKMDTGAPCPLVAANECRVVLSYLLPGSEHGPLSAIVTFLGAITYSLGIPNEDTLEGHLLWSAGLKHYTPCRIENSPLIRELQRIDSVERTYKPKFFHEFNHYIIPMHDSTFECVAREFHVATSDRELDADRFPPMVEALNAKQTYTDESGKMWSYA